MRTWELKPEVKAVLDSCKSDAEREREMVRMIYAKDMEGMSPKVKAHFISHKIRQKQKEFEYHLARAKARGI